MKKFNIKYIHIPCESVSESVTDSEDFCSGFESFEYDFQYIESDLADLEPHSADDAEADSHMLQNFVPFPVTFDRSILIVRTAFDLDEFLTLQVLHVTSLSRGRSELLLFLTISAEGRIGMAGNDPLATLIVKASLSTDSGSRDSAGVILSESS